MATVIGTSTNLVVSGLLEDAGLASIEFFEIGKLGAPIAAAGVLLLIALAPKLLPVRRGARRIIEGDVREFAVRVTGLADRLADVLIDGLDGFGHTAVLAGLVVATVALTELVTNNAAAVLVFPIALSAAATLDQDPRSYAIAVALAASASFLTPIGYQTNTMVWGPGGYRFWDYARLGAPLSALTLVAIVFLTPVMF